MSEAQTKVARAESLQSADRQYANDGVEKTEMNRPSLRSLREEAEVYAISRTLEYTGWNRRRAAQLLSISYRGILYKIRQHNLAPRPRRSAEPVGEILKADSQG